MLEVIKRFFPDYRGGSGHYVTAKKYIRQFGIDTSHFTNDRQQKGLRKTRDARRYELTEILAGLHPTYSRGHLKDRIIREKILEYRCSDCGQTDTWNGKPLSLQLEHRNGISDDHRLENLCFLCPNCHSQTSTYAGRGIKTNRRSETKRSRQEYVDARRQSYISSQHHLVEKVISSGIDFSTHGWVAKVAKIIDKHPQKVRSWMEVMMPDTLSIAYYRSS